MKKIHKHIIFVLTVFLLASCSEDFLDLKPLDQQVTTNFYKTEEQAMQALVAVYDAFGVQSSNSVWAPLVTMSDILSDDSYAGGSDANDGKEAFEFDQHKILPTNPRLQAIWSKNYIGIFRANLFLEKIDGVDASDEFKVKTSAEAKFLRAYFYLELVRYFENVSLLTETIKGPSEYNQPQATPDQTYAQIAADLIDAIKVLPKIGAASQNGRITKWAAQALLARTYLFYNGVYNKELTAGDIQVNRQYVLDELEDLIKNGGFELLGNYGDNFSLSSEFGLESVLEISHGNTPPWSDWGYIRGGNGNLAAQLQGPRVTGSSEWDRGWSFGIVSHKLAEDLKDDPRFDATILTEEEIQDVFASEGKGKLVKGFQHTGYFSQKYSSDAEHQTESGSLELNRTSNIRVIRYSDVLLMAAELGSTNAQAYLDEVRDRVGLTSIPATLENILKERRLELSLEGIRYFDLLRQGMNVSKQELTVAGVSGPNYTDDQVVYDHTFNSATKGFLPIPQTEVDLSNGTFKQNAGYK